MNVEKKCVGGEDFFLLNELGPPIVRDEDEMFQMKI